MSESEWCSSDNDSYGTSRKTRRSKRRRVTTKGRVKAVLVKSEEPASRPFSIEPLLNTLCEQTTQEWGDELDLRDSFENLLESMLPELLEAELAFLCGEAGMGEKPPAMRLLSRQEASEFCKSPLPGSNSLGDQSPIGSLLSAKARTHSRLLRRVILNRIPSYLRGGPLTPLSVSRLSSTVNPQVLDALYAIQTTPYENSFLSRLQGFNPTRQVGIIAVDWETRTPWMELMSDIREHHTLAHPEREHAEEVVAPLTYCTLQRGHLDQVHDLLARVFWDGIDVSDSLDYSPEKCTVVATYKQLVVGAAFLSSPQETYITYLAVRSGWDNSQIATSMLYHLINLNPHKDITLHVSINNPAMLLYNRFGFKAEEFIVGFYEDYLDPNSPQSKNAFRLRLRRW